MKTLLISFWVIGLLTQLSASPQAAPVTAPPVTAQASVEVYIADHPVNVVTMSDLAKLPRQSVTVGEHGKQVQYEGVWLRDVLSPLGVPFGSALRGKALSSYMLATARDGYAAVYTLTEMDPAFSAGDLMLADSSGGKPLSNTQGPLRIVAPHDKKPARSVRMLARIDVVQLRK